MRQLIRKLRRAFAIPFVVLSAEKIPAQSANKELQDHFFKRADGVSDAIHKVVDGCPLYYNSYLKKWRVSSLALIWGHENSFIKVVKISSSKVSEHIKAAEIDWTT